MNATAVEPVKSANVEPTKSATAEPAKKKGRSIDAAAFIDYLHRSDSPLTGWWTTTLPTERLYGMTVTYPCEWLAVETGDGQSQFYSKHRSAPSGKTLTKKAAIAEMEALLAGKAADEVRASMNFAHLLRLPIRVAGLLDAIRACDKRLWIGVLPELVTGSLHFRLRAQTRNWIIVDRPDDRGMVRSHTVLMSLGRTEDGDRLVSGDPNPEELYGREVTAEAAVAAIACAIMPDRRDSVRASAAWATAAGLPAPLPAGKSRTYRAGEALTGV